MWASLDNQYRILNTNPTKASFADIEVPDESRTWDAYFNGVLYLNPYVGNVRQFGLFDTVTKTWSLDENGIAAQMDEVRIERDKRLSETDLFALPDHPRYSPEMLVYRQALRDITTQTDPFNIVWPTQPTGTTNE